VPRGRPRRQHHRVSGLRQGREKLIDITRRIEHHRQCPGRLEQATLFLMPDQPYRHPVARRERPREGQPEAGGGAQEHHTPRNRDTGYRHIRHCRHKAG
jgi:hypothetical protein